MGIENDQPKEKAQPSDAGHSQEASPQAVKPQVGLKQQAEEFPIDASDPGGHCLAARKRLAEQRRTQVPKP